ncbi:hypothetical protein A0U40_16105 [[Bacillus] sp. KCTC 13219]|nr:hypothetical protein A0U40_16105 [[Bacillus] sp. KCTC 13219]
MLYKNADAVKSVQVALDKASAGNQIWVAAGTYTLTKRTNINKWRSNLRRICGESRNISAARY